ncbi:MAG: pyridoxal phosphate-dependent decarboxylase family protein [Planctomycetota bacterium]
MDSLFQTTLRLAEEILATEQESVRRPRIEPEELRTRLDLGLRREGRSQEEVLDNMRSVLAHTPRTSDHRFFNQLFAGRLPIATSAEWLSCLLNVSMYTFKVAGPMILAEQEVARRMCAMAGFHQGDGLSVPGGSMANLVAMLLGRNSAVPGIRENGSDGRKLAFYLSREGHYSVTKNAGILGIGRANVRLIDVDDQGRMQVEHLAATLRSDIEAGVVPCAVIATAGTTVIGAFDPIREIAAITRELGIWLHVDGAFGGSMLLNPKTRALLDGIELADSLTWDAHKAMGIPLMCSMLLTRDANVLRNNLNETADYLFQADDDTLNPGTRSIQCGRRDDTFKLWAAWQQMGDAGWERHIEQQMALTAYAVERIKAEPKLKLHVEPKSITVCFTYEGVESAAICDALHKNGAALIGYGKVFGEETIRLVTVNPEITKEDIDNLFDEILACASAMHSHSAARC